jgi:hypothetical protein
MRMAPHFIDLVNRFYEAIIFLVRQSLISCRISALVFVLSYVLFQFLGSFWR